jgi:hypothetical protein
MIDDYEYIVTFLYVQFIYVVRWNYRRAIESVGPTAKEKEKEVSEAFRLCGGSERDALNRIVTR